MWPSVVEFLFIISVLKYRRENHTRSRAVVRKLKRRGRVPDALPTHKYKMEMIGFRSIFFAILYAFHGGIFDRIRARIPLEKMAFYEKDVSISCDSYIGIRISVEKEPYTALEKLKMSRDVLIPYMVSIGALGCVDNLLGSDENIDTTRWLMQNFIVKAGHDGDLNALKQYTMIGFDCALAYIPAFRGGHVGCVNWLKDNSSCQRKHYCTNFRDGCYFYYYCVHDVNNVCGQNCGTALYSGRPYEDIDREHIDAVFSGRPFDVIDRENLYIIRMYHASMERHFFGGFPNKETRRRNILSCNY